MDRISVEKALIEAAAAAMERARAYILRWPRGRSIPPRLGLWALGRAKEERKQPQGSQHERDGHSNPRFRGRLWCPALMGKMPPPASRGHFGAAAGSKR